MQDLNPHQDTSQALRQLEMETDQLVLPLLRQLEAYLGVLRQQVPHQVLQAVFVLVSQDCPERYSSLSPGERQALQRRLKTLTAESCCVLTVEHLLLLAQKLQAEHQRIKQERRHKMLAALERLNGGEQDESSGDSLVLAVQEPSQDTALPLTPPRHPQGLERWSLWLRQAMVRHLRTLSHQLNIELLNHRLIQAVLPVRLLDAVLAGDVEAMQAPENLLKIAVPMGNEDNAPQVITCVLLLRLQDMEFAYLPLRQSRERLQKHQKDLQNLVTRSRYWQQRLVTEQARADWNNDLQQI